MCAKCLTEVKLSPTLPNITLNGAQTKQTSHVRRGWARLATGYAATNVVRQCRYD
jgi:hypothetical protein